MNLFKKMFLVLLILLSISIKSTDISTGLSDSKEFAEKAFCGAEYIGSKNKMEDRAIIAELEGSGFDLFGVFDGHNGSQVAQFAKQNLHNNIFNDGQFPKNISQAIINGFIKTHNDLPKGEISQEKGCTALVLIVGNGQINIGWAGDSRILLVKSNGKFFASKDHNIGTNQEEILRVINSKGILIEQDGHRYIRGIQVTKRNKKTREYEDATRVVTPTRGLGDKNFTGVIPEPEVFSTHLNDYKFAILATDGLWHLLNNEEAVHFVSTNLPKIGIKETCSGLIKFALAKAEQNNITDIDDITAIIVNLDRYK
jgi:serine/threonine protein phosphatase PrpC